MALANGFSAANDRSSSTKTPGLLFTRKSFSPPVTVLRPETDEGCVSKWAFSKKGRVQVGRSNRWRLDVLDCVGKDLLATTQAIRSLTKECEQTASLKRPQTSQVDHTQIRKAEREGKELHLPSLVDQTRKDRDTDCASPTKLFHSYTYKSVKGYRKPDVFLHCDGIVWELHSTYVRKSATLSGLLHHALISSREKSSSGAPIDIHFSIGDESISKQGFAHALGLLYDNELRVKEDEVADVLAAANLIEYSALEEKCCDVMLRTLSAETVITYYNTAVQCENSVLERACESWLLLNLVPQLAVTVHLKKIPFRLINKILLSPHLFTWNEYALFKVLCNWVYLQLSPDTQVMPAYSLVVAYFQTLPDAFPFLCTAKGHPYAVLFDALRMENITDVRQVVEIQKMRLFSSEKMIDLWQYQYATLFSGGGMGASSLFEKRAMRQGFLLENKLDYISETVFVYTFHFKIKAEWVKTESTLLIAVQRIFPDDSAATLHVNSKEIFSIRPSRKVVYSLRVQMKELDSVTKGPFTRLFGADEQSRRLQVHSFENLKLPIHVTLNLFLPCD
ncbi:BTB/POZ domain-containing protein 16-like isoform X2 [Oscarella lobularis]|uniref:BTB/POZ domain-containing protein 16-like isoform X2 n=1 Tax=Oscarella lobularis TaxID=121494 RepID=UPI003313616A